MDTISRKDGMDRTFLEGVSPHMRALEAAIRELAHSDVPVLLLAETGAGKRTIARRIHEASGRKDQPFAITNCRALDVEELKGPGGEVWRSKGTVFLEEVGALSLTRQAELLEALTTMDGEIPRVQARLISGCARDLEAEVRAGHFREDLYYRISAVCLRLPPLRQRKEDIPAFMNFFLTRYARDFRRPTPALSPQTQQLFHEYGWPGNIRELENTAKAIAALGDESVAMDGLRATLSKPGRPGNGERVSLKQAARAASREAEKELILSVLTRTRWNRRRAAQELQISYKALLYKLKQIGCGEYEAS